MSACGNRQQVLCPARPAQLCYTCVIVCDLHDQLLVLVFASQRGTGRRAPEADYVNVTDTSAAYTLQSSLCRNVDPECFLDSSSCLWAMGVLHHKNALMFHIVSHIPIHVAHVHLMPRSKAAVSYVAFLTSYRAARPGSSSPVTRLTASSACELCTAKRPGRTRRWYPR
jgi:hypothetical protein